MIRKFFFNMVIELIMFLVVLAIFYPKLQQITNDINYQLMDMGAPAGIELNVKDLLPHPGRAESQMVDDLLNTLNNL